MASNDRRDDKGPPPWDLSQIFELTKRDGEKYDHWEKCGTVWLMKDREGMIWTQHFAIPAGARMAATPRKQKAER